MGAVVLEENRKQVVGVFVDPKGKFLKSDSICSFKGNAYEPNIFFDSKRDEIFFTCTVEDREIPFAGDYDVVIGSGTGMKGVDISCTFKGNSYKPKIFHDLKTDKVYYSCTRKEIEMDGIAFADSDLKSGVRRVVLTKRDSNGEHAANTEKKKTKNFVGYTNNMLARTTGYYNELTDR